MREIIFLNNQKYCLPSFVPLKDSIVENTIA